MSHGVSQEEQEPASAEPRICDTESCRYGLVFGHDHPPRPDVRGTVYAWIVAPVSLVMLAVAIVS